ncbi:MAG TPA: DNA mismatch repair endonuclease MutL [Candidatus Binatia bacterium]|jgi:DNA mismatch repair protein MutL|nr:DNA mismatch repair endonuclease MutL [Candidatus Binatia bacterium]
MSIRILPPIIQQRIAAGEVVERPASVGKELIENALDAAADTIRVEIQEGGRRLIKVTDDGPGMSAADVPLAFERFATSKIVSENDLYAVRTFGFRGEALPSIASVSRVRLLTRERNTLLGTEARIEAGKLVSLQEAGAAVGTTIEVWDLFYNTPARRQFLRSLRTEYGHILGVFTRFALAFPEKSFSLYFDGREVYTFPPTSLQERITACFGREAAAGLEEFASTGIAGRVWGFVLSTEEVWRRRYYFFVNRRPVRNRTLYRAARDTLQGEGGMVFLFLELHPSQIDINIHPAKTEVRFRDDIAIYDLVRGALQRRALPSWLQTGKVAEPEAAYSSGESGGFTLIGQIENTFLLTLAEGHLYLLDQHAAEERVLYEQLQQGKVQSRELIAPQVVSLSHEEQAFLEGHQPEVVACGFTVEPFGSQVVALRAIPAFVDPKESGLLFSRLLMRVRNQKEDFRQALSCLAAVKAGQPLAREAQELLLAAWTQTANPHACAHNRPVYFRLSLDEVRRKVGRTGLSCEFDRQQE